MDIKASNENIKFIKKVIKDRDEKKVPTFYVIKLDNNGTITPMTGREEGKTFEDTITEYLLGYPNTTIVVELYTGKSPSVKGPFDTKRIIPSNATNSNTSLSGVKSEYEYTTPENVVNADRYISSVIDRERENIKLTQTMLLLEHERDELKKKNKKKKKRIIELEQELEKKERSQNKSIANVSLGGIASNAMEHFAKSDFGIGLLKNVFGAKQEVINGLLGVDHEESTPKPRSKASVITEDDEPKKKVTKQEQIRNDIINHISDFLKGSNDAVLRLYYELIELMKDDISLLQQVYTQVSAFRKNSTNTKAEAGEDPEDEKDETEKDIVQKESQNQKENFENTNNPEDIDDS